MIISTTETIPGKEIIEVLGIARGSTVSGLEMLVVIFLQVSRT